jgi:parvulin-like peptidyl-prolyl isomerase
MTKSQESKQHQRPAKAFLSFRFRALDLFRVSNFGFRASCLVLAALLVLPALLAGCGGDRKSALTEDEIRRLTYAPAPTRSDEIKISGETITCEDIMMSPPEEAETGPSLKDKLQAYAREVPLEQFLAEARPLIRQQLNRNITRIVLSKRAQRELGAKADDALDKMAEKELRRFIVEEHGGNGAEADAALQRRGMTRSSYKEYRKRDILSQHVIDSRIRHNRPVTHGEILTRYNQIKDREFVREGVLQFRLIEVQVARITLDGPEDDPFVKAGELAAELRKRIDAGEDFAELARQHSHGHRSADGGLWRPRDPSALAPPYDALARQAQGMRPGEVAGPIDQRSHLFIMKLEEKQDRGYRPLAEVQDLVREDVRRERRRMALQELEADITRQAGLVDTTPFVDYCLERLWRLARASSDNQS